MASEPFKFCVLCASGSHEPSVHNDSLIERATAHLNRVDYEGESYAVISQLIRALKAKTKATDGLVTIFGGHLYGTQQEKDAYKKWYFARLHDGVHPECKSYFVKVVPGDMLSSLILVCACGEETDITDYSNV